MSTALASSTRIDANNRAEWLASRNTFIGASESWNVCKGNRLKVYLQKAGLLEDEPPKLAMRIGLALEPLIAERYQEEGLGKIAETQVFLRSDEHPFIAATIDGRNEDGSLVEFKYASGFRREEFGDDGTDMIPEPWLFQAQQQMFVAGAEVCDFAVFLGTEFRWFRVHRHEEMQRAMVGLETQFWRANVEPRVAPEIPENAPVEHVLALYREPASWTFLDPSVINLVRGYEQAKTQKRESERDAEALRSHLFQVLGEFQEGHLPDGTIVRRVTSTRNFKPTAARQVPSIKLEIIAPRNS